MELPKVDESLVAEISALYGKSFPPNRNFQESTIMAFDQKHGMVFCLTDDGKVIAKSADLFLDLYKEHLSFMQVLTEKLGDAFFRRNGAVSATHDYKISICEDGKLTRDWSVSPVVATLSNSDVYLLSKSHGVFCGWNFLLTGKYMSFYTHTDETRDGLPETIFQIETRYHDMRMRDLKVNPEKPTGYESVGGLHDDDVNKYSPMNKLEFASWVDSKLSAIVATILAVYTDQESPVKCDLKTNRFLLVKGETQWHLQFLLSSRHGDDDSRLSFRIGRVSGSKFSIHCRKESLKAKSMKDVVSASEFPMLLRKVIDEEMEILVKKMIEETYGT